MTLFGDNPTRHRLFAEHLTAEYRVQTSGRGRTVDEWKTRPEQLDNHWLDGLVGCAVGASIQGTSLLGEKASGGRALRTFVQATICRLTSPGDVLKTMNTELAAEYPELIRLVDRASVRSLTNVQVWRRWG